MRNSIRSALKVSGAAALLGALGLPAQATPGFISETGGSLNSSASDQLYGWLFRVNTPIDVSALGVLDTAGDGLAVAHDVGIYRVSDQSLVVSATVDAGTSGMLDAGFRYALLSSDVLLDPGLYATVMTMPAANPDDQFLNATTVTTAPEISYVISANDFGSTVHYPGKTGLYSLGLFGPNFEFTAAPVPEPGSYALMLGGLAVLGSLVRRRSASTSSTKGPVKSR